MLVGGSARRRLDPVLAAAGSLAGSFSRRPDTATLRNAGAAGLAAGAALIAILAEGSWEVVAAVPACMVAAVLAARLPAVVTLVMLALTGIVGTLIAYTDLSPRYLIDVPLVGLVAATVWRRWIDGDAGLSRMPLAVLLALAYLVISAVQGVLSPDLTLAQRAFRSTAWQVAILPAVALAGWSLATKLRIVRGYLVLIALVTAYAVLRLAVGPADAEREATLALAPTLLPDGELGLFGSTLTRHQLAAWCGIALPFALAAALVWDGSWRWFSIGVAGLTAISLIGTETRGGFVGATVGCAVVLGLFAMGRYPGPRLRRTLLPVAIVLAGVAIGYLATDDSESGADRTVERYTAIAAPTEDPAFDSRLDSWRVTAEEIPKEPLGHGFGTGGLAVENAYLRVGYDQGPLVMLLFVALVVVVVLGLGAAALARRDRSASLISLACCGAFTAAVVIAIVTNAFEVTLAAWTLAGLGIAGSRSPARAD
jgi:hypothetical protein